MVPEALVKFCISSGYDDASDCEEDFKASTFGAIWTQVLAFADVSGLDGKTEQHRLSNCRSRMLILVYVVI